MFGNYENGMFVPDLFEYLKSIHFPSVVKSLQSGGVKTFHCVLVAWEKSDDRSGRSANIARAGFLRRSVGVESIASGVKEGIAIKKDPKFCKTDQ